MKVGISGASGLIGRALVQHLRSAGHDVVRLVRGKRPVVPGDVEWNPASGELDPAALEGIDAFVNLSGENLGDRWSDEKKRAFVSSRLPTTTLIAKTLASLVRRPRVLLSMSAVGIYGNARGGEVLDENSSHGTDFLARLCEQWENAADPAREAGIRVVHPRGGVVINPEGGVLDKLIPIFKMGAGGKVGSGDQWVSWIARTDMADAMIFAIENESLEGPVNVTAPNPVTNEELAKELGHALHRPSVAAVPAAIVRMMIGREMADETVLASQRVLPRKLESAGFRFRFPVLPEALRHELHLKEAS